jgi:glycogen debranching enzyme
MMTPYGIRTQASSEVEFNPSSYQNGSIWPFDNWVIHQGLIKTGRQPEAKKIAQSMLDIYATWGNIPELYAVELDGSPHGINSACRIQAWSAGALINIINGAEPV